MADRTILYIKGEKNTEVQNLTVTLGDILSVQCARQETADRVKSLRILRIPENGQERVVVSVLKIIEVIQQEFPGLDVRNVGETDLILTLKKQKEPKKIIQTVKVLLICGITFLGAAFSIMSFNNDVALTKMFGQIYQLLTGEKSNGFTILEITYCLGLALGILLFFNHFGKKKFSVDPTPMEVEMRLYEKDIETTLIENYDRKGQGMDVGS